jgi:membrane-bound serine protease (ClpP class)
MAASAGTLILLAAHGAAMAPRTTIGAAHPVVSGGEQAVSEDQMEKMINVVVQHAELFADRRGEAAVDWAQRAIRESATAGPQEALELGVIDLVAEDLEALLDGFDGVTVTLGDGREVTLHTADALVEEVAISPIERLLSILVDPNIALLLLTIGVQAILIEISAPGGWVAGFLGAVCLALAAYALGVLTFNWLGLALIGISFVLFVIDVKAPTHGALTVAGIGTFVAGALVLFNRALTYPYGQLSIPLVIVLAVLTGLFFAFVVTKALGAQKRPPVTGKEGLIGRRGTVKVQLDPEGTVLVAGERWDAVSDEGPIPVGQEVEIAGVEGFCLHVRAVQDGDSDSSS